MDCFAQRRHDHLSMNRGHGRKRNRKICRQASAMPGLYFILWKRRAPRFEVSSALPAKPRIASEPSIIEVIAVVPSIFLN